MLANMSYGTLQKLYIVPLELEGAKLLLYKVAV